MYQEGGKYRGKAEHNSRVSTKNQKKLITDLKVRFPELPNNIIRDILENVDWDVNKAIEHFDDGGSQTELECLQSEVATACSSSTTSDESVSSIPDATSSQNNYNPAFYNEIVGSAVNPIKLHVGNLEFEQWINELELDETNVHKIGVPKQHRIPFNPSLYAASSNVSKLVKNKAVPEQPSYLVKGREANGPRSPRIATVYDAVKASSSKIAQSDYNAPIQELNNNDHHKLIINDNPFPLLNGSVDNVNQHHDDDRFFLNNESVEFYNEELFTPTETDDYFDLQLHPNFVANIFQEYSNPFHLLDVGKLPQKDLNVRIPPRLAFELYEILYQHLKTKYDERHVLYEEQPHPITANSYINGIHDGYTEEQLEDIVRMSEVTSNSSPDFLKIQEYEMRLNGHEEKRFQTQRSRVQSNLASKLALHKLRMAFPSVLPQEIERYYGAYNCKYDETLNALQSSYPTKFVPERLTDKFQSDQPVEEESSEVLLSQEYGRYRDYLPSQKDLDAMTPEELRALALKHYHLRAECQEKNRTHREGYVASHYSLECRKHDDIMRKANRAAADKLLERYNGPNESKDKLDLHYLHVQEAVTATQKFLRERTKYMEDNNLPTLHLRIITGKGKNSDMFGSRLSPAIFKFLKKHRYNTLYQQGYIEVTLENPFMQKQVHFGNAR